MPDDAAPSNADLQPPSKWFSVDVQRGLAWTIVLVFSFLTLALIFRVVLSGAIDDVFDLLKTIIAALTNIVIMVMSFFFGSSRSSQNKDETINKIATSAAEPTAPPPPPAPQPQPPAGG